MGQGVWERTDLGWSKIEEKGFSAGAVPTKKNVGFNDLWKACAQVGYLADTSSLSFQWLGEVVLFVP